ncbi:MAG: PHP domain-containing protein [Clostridia bacterium]|nr:PHP domain-containing protein [Clostridia bacterium]
MPIDLHLHSTHSDGTLTPVEIIAKAKSLGLSAVALTDHNTVSGVPAFLEEAEKQGVTAVAGTELSTVYKGQELHLLGLFIPAETLAAVTALTEDYRARKEQSNRDLVASLAADGYRVDYEAIRASTPDGNVNRALIAKALLAGGYVPSVKAAFHTLLGEGMGYYTPPTRPDFFETIRFLRSIRAVPVWAHPLQYMDEITVRQALPGAVEAGLVGMEVMHASYDEATVTTAKALAHEFGLLYSGGSDFHGAVKPDVYMGVGSREGTSPNIPDGYYPALRARAKAL